MCTELSLSDFPALTNMTEFKIMKLCMVGFHNCMAGTYIKFHAFRCQLRRTSHIKANEEKHSNLKKEVSVKTKGINVVFIFSAAKIYAHVMRLLNAQNARA